MALSPLMQKSLIGVGLSYPLRLDASGTRFAAASGEDKVFRSMEAIINTDIFERPFLVKNGIPYGTRVRRALFEPAPILIDIYKYDVPRALRVWEPRIIVLEVGADQSKDDPKLIRGYVRFIYRATNREDNFVRPYRLKKPDNQQ